MDLWDSTPEQRDRANDLYYLLRELPGIGRTKASKLCARKRPHLIPIRDSVVERVFVLGRKGWWSELAEALDADRRAAIDALGLGVDGTPPSTLRLLDVAVWMLGSNAGSARAARRDVGCGLDPLW